MSRLAARVARAVGIAVLPMAAAAVVSACGSSQPPARAPATASIPRALLSEARRVAEALVDEDPHLQAHADLADEVKLLLSEDEGEYLFKS